VLHQQLTDLLLSAFPFLLDLRVAFPGGGMLNKNGRTPLLARLHQMRALDHGLATDFLIDGFGSRVLPGQIVNYLVTVLQ
jgi:hypothetical protein